MLFGASVTRGIMRGKKSRRSILRAGLSILGAAGFGTAFGSAASRANAATRATSTGTGRAAVVSEVRNGTVRVDGTITGWFRIEGFPEGWQVIAGDKVTIAPSVEREGVAAFPSAHWVTAAAAPADLRPGARIGLADGPEMVAATVVGDEITVQRSVGDTAAKVLRVAVADHVSSQAPDRVLAIRAAA
jgi:hypothetical protein